MKRFACFLSRGTFLAITLSGCIQWSSSQTSQGATCRQPILTNSQRDLLDKYLILQDVEGNLILSQKLGYSCNIREGAARWIADRISGKLFPDDKVFEAHQGKELNRIVIRVWSAIANSPAFPSDGALTFDKWNILSAAIVSDEVVGRIVAQEVLRSGLWTAEANLMFTRNLRETPGLVEEVLANRRSDVISKLYALALKTRTTRDGLDSQLLAAIAGVKLTTTQARVVENLRKRIDAHKPAEWSDVEALAADEL